MKIFHINLDRTENIYNFVPLNMGKTTQSLRIKGSIHINNNKNIITKQAPIETLLRKTTL